MSRPLGSLSVPIRWREDTGWELRCETCAIAGRAERYWPLTEEFWDKRRMARCRACEKRRLSQNAKARRRNDVALANRIRERNRLYQQRNRDILNWKRREARREKAA